MPRKLKLDKWIDGLAKFIRDPAWRKLQYDDPCAFIEEFLKREALDSGDCFMAAFRLDQLGHWRTRNGGYRVATNDLAGWSEIAEGIAYLSAGERIYCRTSNRLSYQIALAVCFALAIRDGRLANDMAQCLATGAILDYTQVGFEPFMLWLYNQATSSNLFCRKFKDPEHGNRYAALVDLWCDSDGLTQALYDVCEAHMQFAAGYESDYPQFPQPFDICPLEIIAIQRIRVDAGLPLPAVDHPLMRSPLAKMPDTLVVPSPTLVSQTMEKVRELYPDL